jgi:hypothetical protein
VKKFFIALGSIFLVLLVLGAIGIAIVAIRGTALDKESHAYVEAAIPAIFTEWNQRALLDRASPEFKRAVTVDQLERLFRWASTLGRLQKCDPAQGQAGISITPQTGKVITGLYTAKAKFEKGEATLTLRIIKHGDQWQIARFDVQSPQLIPP